VSALLEYVSAARLFSRSRILMSLYIQKSINKIQAYLIVNS